MAITCFQQGDVYGNRQCNELSQKIIDEHCSGNNCTLPTEPAYCANKNNNNQATNLTEGVCRWNPGTIINEVDLSNRVMYPSKDECNSRFTYGGRNAELSNDGPKQCMWNDSDRRTVHYTHYNRDHQAQIAAFGGICDQGFEERGYNPRYHSIGDVQCSTDRAGYYHAKAPSCPRDDVDSRGVTNWHSGDINCECDGDRWLQEHARPSNRGPGLWRCLDNAIEREDELLYSTDWRFTRMRKEEEQFSPYREPTLECSSDPDRWYGNPYGWYPTRCEQTAPTWR